METKELKKLVEKYSAEKLEGCIAQQLAKGESECRITAGSEDEIIAELSKAEVVRELMDQGRTFPEALRELGRRIRSVYGSEEETGA